MTRTAFLSTLGAAMWVAMGAGPWSVGHAQEFTEARRVAVARQLQRSSVSVSVGRGGGSGFVAGDERWVVTNSHVARSGGGMVAIRFGDDTMRRGRVLRDHPRWDLAIIEVEGEVPVEPLPLADSDRVEVGQSVLAFGSPFGLQGTLTQGIVSARRDLPGAEGSGEVRGLIQTDAPINPGNSGGPLVNARGEVIGVNTAILSRTGGSHGIGFAVPSNYVRRLLEEVRVEVARGGSADETRTTASIGADPAGEVTTPVWLGIYGEEVETPRFRGVRVRGVVPDSPASRAGLRGAQDRPPPIVARMGVPWTGHIILALDGEPVPDLTALHRLLEHRHPGDRAVLTLTVGADAELTGEAMVELVAPPRRRERSREARRRPVARP
jgi:S1-C subfamily serine protease